MTDLPITQDAADNAIDWLLRRYSMSPRHLQAPGPTPEQLALAVQVAGRAPDHEQLRPWRFVWIAPERREALAEAFVADAVARCPDAVDLAQRCARARDKALGGPVLLALLVRLRDDVEDVPAHEQWMAAGGALTNLLNALHLMGFAGKTLSGPTVRGHAVRSALEQPGEQLVAWVAVGTPSRSTHPRRQDRSDPGRLPALAVW